MIFYSLANAHDKTGTDFKMANEVGLNINDTVQISDGTDFNGINNCIIIKKSRHKYYQRSKNR